MKEYFPEEYGCYAIVRGNYKTEDEFRKSIGDAVAVHTANDQQVWIRHEDCGVYVVTYCPNPDFGNARIALVKDDEYEDWDPTKPSEDNEES